MSIPQGAFFIVSQVTIVNGKKKGGKGEENHLHFFAVKRTRPGRRWWFHRKCCKDCCLVQEGL